MKNVSDTGSAKIALPKQFDAMPRIRWYEKQTQPEN